MKQKQTLIEGSPKKIVFASPFQVICIKKQYLKSLSPSKVSENLKSPPCLLYPLPNTVIHKHHPKTSRWLRKHSIDLNQTDRLTEEVLNKKYLEDFAFRGLRINNL